MSPDALAAEMELLQRRLVVPDIADVAKSRRCVKPMATESEVRAGDTAQEIVQLRETDGVKENASREDTLPLATVGRGGVHSISAAEDHESDMEIAVFNTAGGAARRMQRCGV
jgi:hypothetical protein